MSMISRIDTFISDRFYLYYDQANMKEILQSVTDNISFKWTNVWILMMAIVICSVWLNMNSTAVVIGAMLLSPLMWPIIGFGVGMATYDLEMILKAARNLIMAVIISVTIAICYFTLSPLSSPTSEIIARTSPTTRDVIIAICGGIAGIIALTRKEKSLTVIPWVAIATALMPPLCTVGFGIANGMREFALRAFYLFCINSVFIAAATFAMSQYIRFPKKTYNMSGSSIPQKVKWSIILISIITLIPSVLGAADIVQQNLLNNNINRFIAQEITNQWWQVLSRSNDSTDKILSLWIIGTTVDPSTIKSLTAKLSSYQLSGYTLSLNQWLPSESELANQVNTIDELAQSLQKLKSLYDQQHKLLTSIEKKLDTSAPLPVSVTQLYREVSIIYPQVQSIIASEIQGSSFDQDLSLTQSWVSNLSPHVVSTVNAMSGGLQIFDSTTWSINIGDNIVARYLLIIRTQWLIAPIEQQTIQQRLQTRIGDQILIQVIREQ